jgi:hypothetical protein
MFDLLVLGLLASIIFTSLITAYYIGQKSITRSECYKIGKNDGIEIGIQRARIAMMMGKSLDTNEIHWL